MFVNDDKLGMMDGFGRFRIGKIFRAPMRLAKSAARRVVKMPMRLAKSTPLAWYLRRRRR